MGEFSPLTKAQLGIEPTTETGQNGHFPTAEQLELPQTIEHGIDSLRVAELYDILAEERVTHEEQISKMYPGATKHNGHTLAWNRVITTRNTLAGELTDINAPVEIVEGVDPDEVYRFSIGWKNPVVIEAPAQEENPHFKVLAAANAPLPPEKQPDVSEREASGKPFPERDALNFREGSKFGDMYEAVRVARLEGREPSTDDIAAVVYAEEIEAKVLTLPQASAKVSANISVGNPKFLASQGIGFKNIPHPDGRGRKGSYDLVWGDNPPEPKPRIRKDPNAPREPRPQREKVAQSSKFLPSEELPFKKGYDGTRDVYDALYAPHAATGEWPTEREVAERMYPEDIEGKEGEELEVAIEEAIENANFYRTKYNQGEIASVYRTWVGKRKNSGDSVEKWILQKFPPKAEAEEPDEEIVAVQATPSSTPGKQISSFEIVQPQNPEPITTPAAPLLVDVPTPINDAVHPVAEVTKPYMSEADMELFSHPEALGEHWEAVRIAASLLFPRHVDNRSVDRAKFDEEFRAKFKIANPRATNAEIDRELKDVFGSLEVALKRRDASFAIKGLGAGRHASQMIRIGRNELPLQQKPEAQPQHTPRAETPPIANKPVEIDRSVFGENRTNILQYLSRPRTLEDIVAVRRQLGRGKDKTGPATKQELADTQMMLNTLNFDLPEGTRIVEEHGRIRLDAPGMTLDQIIALRKTEAAAKKTDKNLANEEQKEIDWDSGDFVEPRNAITDAIYGLATPAATAPEELSVPAVAQDNPEEVVIELGVNETATISEIEKEPRWEMPSSPRTDYLVEHHIDKAIRYIVNNGTLNVGLNEIAREINPPGTRIKGRHIAEARTLLMEKAQTALADTGFEFNHPVIDGLTMTMQVGLRYSGGEQVTSTNDVFDIISKIPLPEPEVVVQVDEAMLAAEEEIDEPEPAAELEGTLTQNEAIVLAEPPQEVKKWTKVDGLQGLASILGEFPEAELEPEPELKPEAIETATGATLIEGVAQFVATEVVTAPLETLKDGKISLTQEEYDTLLSLSNYGNENGITPRELTKLRIKGKFNSKDAGETEKHLLALVQKLADTPFAVSHPVEDGMENSRRFLVGAFELKDLKGYVAQI